MKKITVMIVDDEKLAQEDLLSLVDWNVLGFEVVATAFNGRQALSKFVQFSPQIVLTDMRMPFMDGVELIEKLRELDSHTEIVVLSAYEDFAYAKTAIRYGISDYVIKSEINKFAFTELLIKLRNRINQNTKNSLIENNQMMTDFFLGGKDAGSYKLGHLLQKEYAYIIVEQDMPINVSGDVLLINTRCPSFSVESIISYEEYENAELVAVGTLPQGQTLVMFDIKECSERLVFDIVRSQANRIKKLLNEALNQSFTVFFVSKRMYIERLKKLLQEKPKIFELKYFSPDKGVVDISSWVEPRALDDVKVNKVLLQEIGEKKDAEAFSEYINSLYNEAIEKESYKSLCGVTSEFFDFLRQLKAQIQYNGTQIDMSYAGNWSHWLNFYDISEWLTNAFIAISEAEEIMEGCGFSKAIEDSIRYIRSNYSDPGLSINDIAEKVHLSSGYLSGLFKSETNTTIKNYIVDVRINAAKKLLSQGHDKIYDVANAVGYVSSQYFSQVFYKKVGVYPNEYKRGRKVEE